MIDFNIKQNMLHILNKKSELQIKSFDKIHENCPRCGGKWIIQRFDIRCQKDKCMRAADSLGIPYEILFLRFKTYQIEWYDTHCSIVYLERHEGTKNTINISHLPYDVTEEQLQLYLTFS